MTSQSEIIVSARRVTKFYRQGSQDAYVLKDVDLEVRRGEFIAIMGPSGSGKTTLLHILGLMAHPSRAESLMIEETETVGLGQSRLTALRRDKIGFVFQRFNLLAVLNAADNVGIALKLRRVHPDHQVERLLEFVGLASKRHLKPGQMSIGEQQRLAFARAVIHRPAILLADEPTGNLDSENTRRLMDLMHSVRREFGQTIIMVTHNQDLAGEADRMCIMKDGQLSNGQVA
ncbi:MAG: ABC transporter ATP-binding protein [Phycisphaerae bacterium]|nr:ABC transporter ATP-binding protein [Phycisphaerae bacterium]